MATAEEEVKADAQEDVKMTPEEDGKPAAEDDSKPKEPEKPTEVEADATSDTRPKVSDGAAAFSVADSTMNVLPIAGGSLMTSLGEGGMQYLLAGARACVGAKAGRYMFEVRIVEQLTPTEPAQQASHVRTPAPKQFLKIGLSLAGSSLFLDGEDCVCFESDGLFWDSKGRRKLLTQRFAKDTIAVVLNLEDGSPNANTVSLFRNGVRATEPQSLPEHLQGKPLYPTVTFRNLTLDVNLGPVPRVPLPFVCRTLGEAAADDVEVAPESKPKDGKYEVVFPVGLPDRGVFDWVDGFLAKNPSYTELSDRKVLQWAEKSGLTRPKNVASNDRPTMKFGVPLLDDASVRSVLGAVAPSLQRNFVVAEVKANLTAADRKAALSTFAAPHFKRKAVVIVGDPTDEFKSSVHEKLLSEKRAKVEAERKRKAADAERKRLFEEKKRKAEEARKAKLTGAKPEEVVADVEMKEEEVKTDEPPVELTEEEKKVVFRKSDLSDLSESVFARALTSFALPTTEEGFQEVDFAWQSEDKSAEALKAYILEQKMTLKAEDLQPSSWFSELWTQWQKTMSEWKKAQSDWKDPAKRKALLAKKAEENKGEDGEAKELPSVNMEELDVMAVEDISDVGNGEPLFANFAIEDWALLSLRYELYLLLQAFKKDLDDPDRPTFPEGHLSFYYQKYYKKNLNLACFGYTSFTEFSKRLIKEVVVVNGSTGAVEAQLADDTSFASFVKYAEHHRRDRARRLDAGDETALLKFSKTPPPAASQNTQAGGGAKRGWTATANAGVPQVHQPWKQQRAVWSGGNLRAEVRAR